MVRPSVRSPAVWAMFVCLGVAGLSQPGRAAEDDASAAWSPKGCGEQPAKPTLDLHDRASYNRSVDLVGQYEAKAKAWNACVQKAAASDMSAVSTGARSRMSAISRSANAEQTQLYAGFGEYSGEFKAAGDKLSKQ